MTKYIPSIEAVLLDLCLLHYTTIFTTEDEIYFSYEKFEVFANEILVEIQSISDDLTAEIDKLNKQIKIKKNRNKKN